MNNTNIHKLANKHTSMWILMWIAFVILYELSVNYQFYMNEWSYVVYIIQFVSDMFIGIYSIKAYRSQTDIQFKRFYLLILMSIVAGLFANEVYNVFVNLIGMQGVIKQRSILWVSAYSVFLVIQIVAWLYVLKCKEKPSSSSIKNWLVILPYIQSSVVIVLPLIGIGIFQPDILRAIGLTSELNSMLEIVLFGILSYIFSRAKNISLIYLSIGFLLLIAFNIAHRFSHMMGQHYRIFDVTWLVALIVIAMGLKLSCNKNEKIEFYVNNSIHVVAGSSIIFFSTFVISLFLVSEFLISSIEISNFSNVGIFVQNIPSALIFSFTLSLLVSKIVASKLSSPLEKISDRVDMVNEGKLNVVTSTGSAFPILEIEKLDRYILSSISALKVANRVKADFLMSMSHDFRTPTSGIYHAANSIYKRISDPKLKKLQGLVVGSTEQLLNALEEVLHYAQLDAGTLVIETQYFDLNLLINDTIQLLMAKANEKNIVLTSTLQQDPLYYFGDKSTIYRILLNLVTNAIKFTQEGAVTISADSRRKENKEWLVIKVKDTGIGIDKINQEAIFEPFYKIKPVSGTKNTGIGLGLSNVRMMLSKLGGEITVQSDLGVGSVFSVWLPKSLSPHNLD